jgi:hypothetical protein
LSLVWLEIGIVARRPRVMVAAAALPMGFACLAAIGHRDQVVYRQFLQMFIDRLGATPFYLALVAATLFLVYAVARRVPFSGELLALGLTGLAVVGPGTLDLDGLVSPRTLPIGGAGLVLAASAWWRRDSLRGALAAACLVASVSRIWEGFWFSSDPWPVWLHASVLALVVIGALFDDRLGRLARRAGALALVCLGLDAAWGSPRIWPSMPQDLVRWYPFLMAISASLAGMLTRDRAYPASASINVAAWLTHSGAQGYSQLRRALVGLDQIAWGMLFFLVATAISLRKAGLWPRSLPKRLVPLLGGWSQPRCPAVDSRHRQVVPETVET